MLVDRPKAVQRPRGDVYRGQPVYGQRSALAEAGLASETSGRQVGTLPASSCPHPAAMVAGAPAAELAPVEARPSLRRTNPRPRCEIQRFSPLQLPPSRRIISVCRAQDGCDRDLYPGIDSMPTYVATPKSVTSRWHLIDAEGQVLGRIATHAARLLQGKHKATYTPFIDTGDHVVIINVAKVKLTGRKEEQKIYRHHSGYAGGLREERAKVVRQRQPIRLVEAGRARHAAEVEDGRRDVPQGEGVRGRDAPAPGSATHSVRGRINRGCYSVLRHRAPQGSNGPRVPPSRHRHHHGQPPHLRQVLPHRSRPRPGHGAADAHRDQRAVRRAGHGQRRRHDRPGRRHPPRASRARCARSTRNCGRS